MIPFDIGQDAKVAQRRVILAALQDRSLSTIEARERFGIGHPAGRCMELRRQGYPIQTEMRTVYDHMGRPRRSAVYTLQKVAP